jgi:uncharacterized protein YdeI (YjbR/CyaY-like superfamily)
MNNYELNKEVIQFLDSSEHPMRNEIEELRKIIMTTGIPFKENIKWSGPNYSIHKQDRVTIRINPTKQIQLIFHRGAKTQEQPKDKLIADDYNILDWKSNDRAVASFKNMDEIIRKKEDLQKIITKWVEAAIQ